MLKRRLLGIIKLKGEKMSKKKSKLFMSLLSLAFCLGIMCFGVYAATSVSYTLSGHITYEVNDVFVDIETRHYLSTQTDLGLAKGEVASVMENIATSLESDTTSIDGVTELASDYDEQSTLNNVGGEELPLTGPALNITYGAYSNTLGQEKAYVHYIAILVTNYAEEEINGILDLDALYDLTGSNSAIYPYRTMENIPAKSGETNGVMSYVFALGLDQPAQSVDVDFSGVSLSVTRGNLDQYASSGLEYEYSEANGGYLVSSYTGTDTRIIIPTYNDNGTNGEHPVVGTKEYPHWTVGTVFNQNSAFREIYIPDSLVNISDTSFYNCRNLRLINLSSNIEDLGNVSDTFDQCPKLSFIFVDDDNQNYCDENGVLFDKSKTTLIKCPSNYPSVSYKISQSVTDIQLYAFDDNTNLTAIVIGANVEKISNYGFYNCNNLQSVTFEDTAHDWTVNGNIIKTTEEIKDSVAIAQYIKSNPQYSWSKNN